MMMMMFWKRRSSSASLSLAVLDGVSALGGHSKGQLSEHCRTHWNVFVFPPR